MNISDIAKSLSSSLSSLASRQSSQSAATRATQKATEDPVTKALTQATQRVEQQLQKSEVKLSSLGQIKSAVAELQTASKALSAPKSTENVDAAKAAAQNFVNAFNNANKVANKAINGEGKSSGALADESRARVAANELSRSISSSPSTAAELKAIGITADKNGALQLDKQKFEQAFQSNPSQTSDTLAQAGQQVERTASRQVENNGNVSRSIDNLNNQVRQLETQQSNQQNLIENLQRAREDASNRLNATNAAGVAAYQKIFTL